ARVRAQRAERVEVVVPRHHEGRDPRRVEPLRDHVELIDPRHPDEVAEAEREVGSARPDLVAEALEGGDAAAAVSPDEEPRRAGPRRREAVAGREQRADGQRREAEGEAGERADHRRGAPEGTSAFPISATLRSLAWKWSSDARRFAAGASAAAWRPVT